MRARFCSDRALIDYNTLSLYCSYTRRIPGGLFSVRKDVCFEVLCYFRFPGHSARANLASVAKLSVDPESFAVPQDTQIAPLLVECLQRHGWSAEQSLDEVYVTGYHSSELRLEQNLILDNAIGCVRAGSFDQGYADEKNGQWQLRYDEKTRTLVKGSVVFPYSSTWEQQSRSLTWIREMRPQDSERIAALSSLPLDPCTGTILVALVGGIVRAFVQYHPVPGEEQAVMITRITTRPSGRKQGGYPQALVAHLQRRFPSVMVGRLPANAEEGYRRVWKQLGFTQFQPEGGSQRTQITYIWHA